MLCFIALLPPEPLMEKVKELKLEFKERYGSKRALRLPAHVTLQPPFTVAEDLMPRLHTVLEEFAKNQASLEISISGFGAFKPKVIFLKVAEPTAVKKMRSKLQKNLQKEDLLEGEDPREFKPHITLATRDLARDDFKEAWQDFGNRKFVASFRARAIYLFQHNGKSWNVNHAFNFRDSKT